MNGPTTPPPTTGSTSPSPSTPTGTGASTGTTTLWRPTGPEELALVEAADWRAWPPRLPDQPIFYPVLNEDYAIRIARDWNVPASGVGYVTRFEVDTAFLARYPVRQAGGRTILELWVPAEELPEFNRHLVGRIEVVHAFRPQP
ncbi:ADP-ribosylation/crystallin J1 [Kitasatospora sp. NPDC097605]|uniref:ADP-ribosylation/crystallin J1 n=1 Tax=Kitasatospora sp. NPDC097605 TaxID=3157226 RepID=UPI0033275D76